MRKAEIKMYTNTAGYLVQDEEGFSFTYSEEYLNTPNAEPISLTLPLQKEAYKDKVILTV